ncbi:FAD-dependent oxidoreductase, partial [Zymomonas sp.]|uniref:FAD-dependent oxidoreductase n=1 Tax=Zymomonas sp. TaxID=2068624 RepID=UPI0025E2D961
APDGSGRRSPEPDPARLFDMDADLVICALGFSPEDLPTLFNAPELSVTPWGTVEADPVTLQTSIEGIFAAGDIVRGASLVVWAIRDGLVASEQIHQWLSNRQHDKQDAATKAKKKAVFA